MRILKRLLEIAGSFSSAKLRISLKCESVKITILWNGKSLRIWGEEKHRKRKVCGQCAHELRVAQVGMVCAFCFLQVKAAVQKV